ncbi:hypothetical protein [Pseudoalteromonas sp. 2CM36K]|uniref:hypothetical protein n=1 Tax=Pseudoalteromonas sp. 2CM36K TaxID=2929854 RepID=UPI0020C08A7F|nr:hypothetical protein [Pseudoalteromonas sp. 2CM36K]MCK8103119.1 hypothetical protein [Pseudoalteromonas sp. 2CM36K]
MMNLRQKQDLALSKKMKTFLEECNSKLISALETKNVSDDYQHEISLLIEQNTKQIQYLSEEIKSFS